MAFVHIAQAPPKAGANELLHSSLDLIHEFTSLFSPKVIYAGWPSQDAGLCRHQCFPVVAQATAKMRPRPAQGLFSFERTS